LSASGASTEATADSGALGLDLDEPRKPASEPEAWQGRPLPPELQPGAGPSSRNGKGNSAKAGPGSALACHGVEAPFAGDAFEFV
jgi:hypothetical protein